MNFSQSLLTALLSVRAFHELSDPGLPGKTTLIKALTGDAGLEPCDQLFATLDVTVHAGLLPCHMTALFVDTIGFLSQLPHRLIDSFSATLEDVIHSVGIPAVMATGPSFTSFCP